MKRGYVIAKNALATDFFTSASAYDRPKWIPLAEATVYPTAELADNAAKKLYKNGSYSAKIVSLQEMQLEISPIDDEELPPEDEMGLGGEEGLEGDLDGEEGKDEDEMVASEQQDVCPDCEHDPCTCADKEPGEDEFDDLLGGSDDLGDEFDDELDGDADLEFDGEPGLDDDLDSDGELDDELEQEADPRFDERRLGMAQRSPTGGPRMESASIVKDPAQKVEDNDSFVKDEKVRVPANVISELKAKIAELDKEAEFNKNDDARASFCLTASAAMKDVLELLQQGTSESIKMANVRMSSYMNPITSKIPASVVKFVYSGGVKPSLKDLFNAKREEKK